MKRYFEEELEFLRDLGESFALDHPQAAAALRMRSQDPDVERLLEGCAFLTARVRQEMDVEFPELLYPLLQQIWPDCLRPSPALGIVQLQPVGGNLTERFRLPRGTRLQSRGFGARELDPRGGGSDTERVRIGFRTCYDVEILPLELLAVQTQRPQPNLLRLRLLLAPLEGVTLDGLGGEALRFYLHGGSRQSFGLSFGLSQNPLVTLRLLAASGSELASFSGLSHPRKIAVRELGWSDTETLLPSTQGFPGHRFLRDFFLFPEKHLLYDVQGLGLLAGREAAKAAQRLEVVIDLAALDDDYVSPPGLHNVRLFCTPVVNLVAQTAQPIEVDLTRPDYPVVPLGGRRFFDIYSVERVTSGYSGSRTNQQTEFHPFPAYVAAEPGEHRIFYQVRPRPPVSTCGGSGRSSSYQPADVFVSFVDENGVPASPPARNVEVHLLLTNRELPQLHLLTDPNGEQPLAASTEVPASIRSILLGPLSEAQPAPIGRDGLWRFLAQAQLGYRSVATVEALRDLLQLYHVPHGQKSRLSAQLQRLLDAIVRVEQRHEMRMLGTPRTLLPGIQVAVHLKEPGFENPGQLRMFGAALSRLLANLGAINSYSQLTIQVPGREALCYPPRVGNLELL